MTTWSGWIVNDIVIGADDPVATPTDEREDGACGAASNKHLSKWSGFMTDCGTLSGRINPYLHAGRLTRINGLVMEAAGLKLPLGSAAGSLCRAATVAKPKWWASTATSCS
jgi:hypothetical protein